MFEFLKELIGEAYTDEVEKKVAQEVGKAYVPKSKYDEVNSDKKALEKTISDRDAQLEALKGVDADGLKAQIEALQAENKTAAEKYAAELKASNKRAKLQINLIKDGAVDPEVVGSMFNLDDFDDDLKGYEAKRDEIKAQKTWTFPDESVAGTTGRDHGSGSGAELTVQDAIAEAMYPKKT